MKRSEELRIESESYAESYRSDKPELTRLPAEGGLLLIASELAALREAIEERWPKLGEQPKLEGFHRGNS